MNRKEFMELLTEKMYVTCGNATLEAALQYLKQYPTFPAYAELKKQLEFVKEVGWPNWLDADIPTITIPAKQIRDLAYEIDQFLDKEVDQIVFAFPVNQSTEKNAEIVRTNDIDTGADNHTCFTRGYMFEVLDYFQSYGKEIN